MPLLHYGVRIRSRVRIGELRGWQRLDLACDAALRGPIAEMHPALFVGPAVELFRQ
ncbi:MAG: hypothetical protein PVF93_10105 [Chromatiaceae bacterium]